MNTMTTVARTSLLAGLLLLSGGEAAAAQQQVAMLAPVAATEAAATIDPAEVRARLAQADEHFQAARFGEARQVLAELAEEQKAAGVSAAETLVKLAHVEYGRGKAARAAVVLDDAAAEAEAHGQPEVQARALLEAATLYTGAREHEKAVARLERLSQLLDSPHLPQDLRAEIEARVQR